ncbi:hypothetical protein GGP91_002832 [Salinibacter ruber]|jgi:hypothetical protein|nr:hypothetical protein [Salinibacter ruber]MCS3830739.1 hypothetical protein [Salinibacter ruber]MCS4162863.1 hypothetical protein [Salinibacter ruber]
MGVSYFENGAKGNPWIKSLWGRTKAEIGSRITKASSLPALRTVFDERFICYNYSSAATRSGGTPRSGRFNPENTSGKPSLPANQNLKLLLRLNRN